MSEFLIARRQYEPRAPLSLMELDASAITSVTGVATTESRIAELFPKTARQSLLKIAAGGASDLARSTPLRVGAVFSG
ncbi:MAG: hypothetical protein EBU49_03670, partial [Proteobacteria bacterium]|nr:hypothetical protein [Pseudomonadota bacterium]